MKHKIAIVISALLILMFCGCNQKDSLESEIKEIDTKLTSLNNDLIYYQNVYDKALNTYQQHCDDPSWENELSQIKDNMDKTMSKISRIKTEIDLYTNRKEIKENKLKEIN